MTLDWCWTCPGKYQRAREKDLCSVSAKEDEGVCAIMAQLPIYQSVCIPAFFQLHNSSRKNTAAAAAAITKIDQWTPKLQPQWSPEGLNVVWESEPSAIRQQFLCEATRTRRAAPSFFILQLTANSLTQGWWLWLEQLAWSRLHCRHSTPLFHPFLSSL